MYDASGRRVQETIGAASKDYVFDQAGRVITQMSPGWARSELYAGGLHVATYTNSTTYFDHRDWLGTVRARSSVSGASVETCTSLPFGDAQTCTGTDWSPLHFTGQDWDSESSLTHFVFRQLSTTQGRWITPDPAGMGAVSPGDPQSWNRYAYVSNNPLNAVDPLGLFGSDAECSGIACDYFLQQLDASNRSIDFSFDSFVKWNAQHTFDDQGNSLWSQLPGKSNPIREGLEDYLDNPFISAPGIEGYTPDEGSSGPGTGQCSDRIVGALNGVLGTNFTTTNVAKVFPAGIRTAQNILMNSNGVSLTAAQFNAIQPGARWSLNPGFLGSVLGIGPALHIADPNSLFDRKFAQFDASNNGGQLSINTMVLHIDDGNSHLPGGFFEHLFRDVIFRNRPPCP